MFVGVAGRASSESHPHPRRLKPTDERDFGRTLREALAARRLHESLFRKNGFKVTTGDGRDVALGGLPLAVLLEMGERYERGRVSSVMLDWLAEKMDRHRTTLRDAVLQLVGYGFVEQIGNGARYGITPAGINALHDWTLYFAREKFVEFQRNAV